MQKIASIVRFVRIPVIVTSVYGYGYQQGIMDCTKAPVKMQESILSSVLMSTGVKEKSEVEVVTEKDISFYSYKKSHQVAAVGSKIIQAAKEMVTEEIKAAEEKVNSKLPKDIAEEERSARLMSDSYVQFWTAAREQLDGEDLATGEWQYILVQSELPNAFVSEALPQKIFITTAMLDLATNADELALILGHELSHLICGHNTQANMIETVLRTIEVLLLSVDPTSGILTLGFIGLLAGLRGMASASFSRDHESEADEMGIKIAARACFDTSKGTIVMRKMHEHSVSIRGDVPTDNSIVRLYDSHPPSLDRFKYLQSRAEDENYTKYTNKQCKTMSSQLREALWGSSRKG